MRNSFVGDSLASVKFVFQSKQTPTGHVKLLFRAKEVRDEALKRGHIFVGGRKVKVVEVDWNREVRRCYKCQGYGHIKHNCSASVLTCGLCAGGHDTRDCDSKLALKCANCKKQHAAGDPQCTEQQKAVRRLRVYVEQ